MEFLNNHIVAIGHTDGDGQVVLIKSIDINNPHAKCCTFEFSINNTACHTDIQEVLKFNNVNPIGDKLTSDAYIARVNRSILDEDAKVVNAHLVG